MEASVTRVCGHTEWVKVHPSETKRTIQEQEGRFPCDNCIFTWGQARTSAYFNTTQRQYEEGK